MSGNPASGWKYYHPVGNPSNLVGNPSTLVGNLTAKLPGNPTGGWNVDVVGFPTTVVGNPSTLVGIPSNLVGNLSTKPLKKYLSLAQPILLAKKYHKKAWVKENLVNFSICFIKGSVANIRLLKNTFKPLVVGIPTT